MNRYGQMAFDHTRRHRPTAFASLSDPTGHFSRLGAEIQTEISRLRDELVGSLRSDEDPEAYRLRSYQALRQAEELMLTETVWLAAEKTPPPEDEQVAAYRLRLATMSRALSAADRTWTDTPTEAPTGS
jgi:hypothetical protein